MTDLDELARQDRIESDRSMQMLTWVILWCVAVFVCLIAWMVI